MYFLNVKWKVIRYALHNLKNLFYSKKKLRIKLTRINKYQTVEAKKHPAAINQWQWTKTIGLSYQCTKRNNHDLRNGTYIRRTLRYRCARKEQSLLYDLFEAFSFRSRSATNRIFFYRKDLFYFMRAQHGLSYHLIYVP